MIRLRLKKPLPRTYHINALESVTNNRRNRTKTPKNGSLEDRTHSPHVHESAYVMPEIKLLIAILVHAIHDAYGKSFCEKDARDAANRWFNSDENNPFSFAWICEHLNINMNTIRKFPYENIELLNTMVKCPSRGYEYVIHAIFDDVNSLMAG